MVGGSLAADISSFAHLGCRKEFIMAMREDNPISTMMGLLRAMARAYGSRKTGALLRILRSTPPKVFVEEYFDDGKGHSGAFTSDCTDVVPKLFERALVERYVSGVLKPGYVSSCEFAITDFGNDVHHERIQIADGILKELSSGDNVPFEKLLRMFGSYHVPEEAIKDIFDWLVSESYVGSHEHEGRQFCFLAMGGVI